MQHDRSIAVIGLGYVGLPVAVALAASGAPVIGFDISRRRVAELQAGRDHTREVDAAALSGSSIRFSADPDALRDADFFIVTVPTPIDAARRPDMSAVMAASETVGAALSPGAIVVYESTVYPGATEDECVPVLERASGLTCGRDFTVGYSPERINPGDREHRLETIVKVVAGQDDATLDVVAAVYGSVVTAGIHRAPSIRVAEAAKVIENAQRDLNIAFMNELSEIFGRMDIDTYDVLAAAGTKWNFLRFTPGLVGGHCISVDPYYLTHKAQMVGLHPEVILAGRRTNDDAGARIGRACVQLVASRPRPGRRITVLGVTFKENVPDIRNSKVIDVIRELQRFGMEVAVSDCLADPDEVRAEYGLDLVPETALGEADAVVLAVPHASYLERGWDFIAGLLSSGDGVVMDLKARLDRGRKPEAVRLWRP
ncbi:nucleotide sugar dehydrogenase [Amorphus coralli]|uniref:nucleotide sugar dehydrogenase n=1 Tax=Amorphus coralli TaxID=340680 RepID=UPI0003692723|nr:nucleotide sugar dehydrogenase [Amorphus coralli]